MAKNVVNVLLFVAVLLFISSSLSAQEQLEPKPQRFDVTPFFGYRTGMSFPTEPFISESNPRIVVDASPSYGVSFGVRLPNYEDLLETRWARQDSYVHSVEVTRQLPRQRVILDQFHGDFSHEFLVEDWNSRVTPFAMASVGATHISSSTNISFTRFSFGVGGGIRFYASRYVYFKVQAEWLPLVLDPHVAFVCGGGCIVHLASTLASQGEIFVGPTFRF